MTADGSAAFPFCTIGQAIVFALDGDSILVAPGSYGESLNVNKDLYISGSAGAAATILEGQAVGRIALVSPQTSVLFKGLTFQNGSGSRAGAIWNRGSVTIQECVIANNSAFDGSGLDLASGGVFSDGPLLIIRDSTLRANRITALTIAGTGSAVMAFPGASIDARVEIYNSTIVDQVWGNQSAPAVYTAGASLYMTNVTVTGNEGGGVQFTQGFQRECRLTHCTVTNNHGTNVAGLRGSVLGSPQRVQIDSSIIAGNSGSSIDGDTYGAMVSEGHNLIGAVGTTPGWVSGVGDLFGTQAAPLDAGLTSLEDAGGASRTHGLVPSSPALDAGRTIPDPTRDQRGVPRPAGAVDIGAREMSRSTEFTQCAGQPNSTGQVGRIAVSTDELLASNAVDLTALNLPPFVTAIFLTAKTAGSGSQPGGSVGNLCLGSNLGLFNTGARVMEADSLGRIALRIDLAQMPTSFGSVSVTVGESWFFQSWHRDLVGAQLSSNFTAAVEASWQ